MTRLLVPDASVILKWVLPEADEPHADRAKRLLADYVSGEVDLVVPTLWYFEVGNTVSRKIPSEARRILAALRGLELRESGPNDGWEARAVDLVATCAVTFYDASYHALAITAGGTLVTGDRTYRDKAHQVGALAALEDYPWQA